MLILVDTGILLRLLNRSDPEHHKIRAALPLRRLLADISISHQGIFACSTANGRDADRWISGLPPGGFMFS